MGSIHIGIGHDDDLVVTKLGNIEIVMNAGTKCCDHGFDLRIAVDPVQSGFLYIQDLASQRQDRLGITGAGSLSGTTCGISLYDLDLAFFRVFIGTVCQFSWKCHAL